MGSRTRGEVDQTIARLFRRRRVARIGALQKALKTTSRMTVWRHLHRHDYLTSFTDKGSYYTLRTIPRFDENGLWFHEGVGFSKYGTLKETVANLVEVAEAGRTQGELRRLVMVRVQETLLALVNTRRIRRKLFPAEYLYFSMDQERASQQLSRRKQIQEETALAEIELPLPLVVEILLEIVYASRAIVDPARIATRLRERGINVSAEDVKRTLERYGIAKKGAS